MTTEKDFLADLERLSGVTPETLHPLGMYTFCIIQFIPRNLRGQPLRRNMRKVICSVVPSHHIAPGSGRPFAIDRISDEAVAFLNTHAQTIANLIMIAYNDEQLLSRS